MKGCATCERKGHRLHAGPRAGRCPESVEKKKAANAAYYAAHREERWAYDAAYYAAHREEKAAYDAAYNATPKRQAAEALRGALRDRREW